MKITNLGFPNVYSLLIKKAVEGFWKGEKTIEDILSAERKVLAFNAQTQSKLDLIPAFDVDTYDRLLRTAVMFGIAPERFGTAQQANDDLAVYLSIPRGTQNAKASPMVKWFNTNYHVIQPEVERDPRLVSNPRLPDLTGKNRKLALIGPWTLLSHAINKTGQSNEQLFEKLAAEYVNFINGLPKIAVQLEEPSFLTHGIPNGYANFAGQLNQNVHLHVYFEAVNRVARELFSMPVQGIGLDFVDGHSNLELLSQFPSDKLLIAGVVNGRNVWPVSTRARETLEAICGKIPDERAYISPSCSLQHVPITAKGEKGDFSFALEKLEELKAISDGTVKYRESAVQEAALPDKDYGRSRSTFWVSDTPFPTTTIGSFPQTPEVRNVRSQWNKGEITEDRYKERIKGFIADCIRRQERLGLDVLVHGEFERTDMVEYFANHFKGFTPIKGEVQSYGTRLVRPPVVTEPVEWQRPFTVEWIAYAQSLTNKPVKGMLTGPVTMVQWSYPREDVSKEAQFYDVAQAVGKEFDALTKAGIVHIQIDEPALREGLPLDPSKRDYYLSHAVNAFKQVYSNAPDVAVIHSHICFSEFSDIMYAIAKMGVDVLSIEDSKAGGKAAASLREAGIPFSIGLGVYDVHSRRIPSVGEITKIPNSVLESGMLPAQIWINPDCGLKTRGPEAWQQLQNMVTAAAYLRQQYAGK